MKLQIILLSALLLTVAPVSAGPSACEPGTESIGQTTITTSENCHKQIDIKAYDCVWNCSWKTIVDTDALTVRHYTQNDS